MRPEKGPAALDYKRNFQNPAPKHSIRKLGGL
jgi:hypothetical protein